MKTVNGQVYASVIVFLRRACIAVCAHVAKLEGPARKCNGLSKIMGCTKVVLSGLIEFRGAQVIYDMIKIGSYRVKCRGKLWLKKLFVSVTMNRFFSFFLLKIMIVLRFFVNDYNVNLIM